MLGTRVGYTGGVLPSPTYRALGDHTESVQVVFDPARISYEQLLSVFFDVHHPTTEPWSRQYRSALFVTGDAQRRAAEQALAERARRWNATVYTAIEDAGTFWPAEDYHQKYRLQGDHTLLAEVRRVYPDVPDWGGSTAVTRINAYLGGWGSDEQLERELPQLGLSDEGQVRLREAHRR